MTQSEKELLLKDLCARLPYGVKFSDDEGNTINVVGIHKDAIIIPYAGITQTIQIDRCKPYLFPLSSMTNEQKEFIKNKFCYDWDIDDHPYSLWAYCIVIGDADELIDWFHKNHIDYRGLIPMGLANDATGKNIY